MINDENLKPIPCLLTMDKDRTFRLYDVRYDHPESLILSFRIKKPEKSGFCVWTMYNHLRRYWIDSLYQRLKRACKKARQRDGKQTVKRPTAYKKKWKAARKGKDLFGDLE